MAEFDFEKNSADDSVYKKETSSKDFIIIAVYVDDLIIISNNIKEIDKFKSEIKKIYNLKDLGELSTILGMKWSRNRKERKSILKQEKYIEDTLEKFGMKESKTVSTPVVKMEEDKSKLLPGNEKYMEAVGSLIYIATCTRPNISFAVSKVSQKLKNPTEMDWISVKRIMRYLQGTKELGLIFEKKEGGNILQGWADADWAGDDKTRLSRSGYIFKLANAPISWISKKQSTVALSTAEAEYISGSLAVQEAIWLNRLLTELGEMSKVPILNLDNQGALALAKNPVHHSRTKHIEIRYHFIREKVLKNEIELRYCATQNMIADILTKPLAKPSFQRLIVMMGLGQ